jgi:nitrous oxide reductase accessory protein NosL
VAKRKHRAWMLVLASAVSLTASCGSDDSAPALVDLEPVAITDQEGAVCGMLIREQSAPRAQVVHRDGEHAFLCGVGDLLAYLDAPSPHGAPMGVLVEVMHPGQQPSDSHTGAHPWIPAEQGVYVVGIERQQIMGPPVLVYRDRAAAEQVAVDPSAKILTWDELRPWWKSQQGGAAH